VSKDATGDFLFARIRRGTTIGTTNNKMNTLNIDYRSHVYSMNIAKSLLKHAQFVEANFKYPEDRQLIQDNLDEGKIVHPYMARMSSLAFLAFALEGYLHFIGESENGSDMGKVAVEARSPESAEVFGIPEAKWNSLKTLERLEHVAKSFGIPLMPGEQPHQSVQELIDYRNSQAHPKNILVNNKTRKGNADKIAESLTIKQDLDAKHAERYHNHVDNLVRQIESKRPGHEDDVWKLVSTSFITITKPTPSSKAE
jgi:hypothetical protein